MAGLRAPLTRASAILTLAAAAVIGAAPAALAYPGVPAAASVVATTCGAAVPAGGTCSITARFVDSDGNPIVGASVSWTVTDPPGGSITPNPSITTGPDGTTTVTYHAPGGGTAYASGDGLFLASVVELAASGTCTGSITGTTGGVSVSLPITTSCATSGGNLLPTASTLRPGGGLPWALYAVAAVGMLVVVGAVARFRRSRRRATA